MLDDVGWWHSWKVRISCGTCNGWLNPVLSSRREPDLCIMGAIGSYFCNQQALGIMMNNDWSIWSRREDTRIRCKAEVFRETCCPFLVSYGRVGIHPCFSRTRLWVWTSPQGCASADMRAMFKALSKPFSLMIVGSYTIKYIGDDHHPLREIHGNPINQPV